jgi:hypothetical protein
MSRFSIMVAAAVLTVTGAARAQELASTQASYREWVKTFPAAPEALLQGCKLGRMINDSALIPVRCPVEGFELGYFLDGERAVMMVVSGIAGTEQSGKQCRAAFESLLPGLGKAKPSSDGVVSRWNWQQGGTSYQLLFTLDFECTLMACRSDASQFPLGPKNPCLAEPQAPPSNGRPVQDVPHRKSR